MYPGAEAESASSKESKRLIDKINIEVKAMEKRGPGEEQPSDYSSYLYGESNNDLIKLKDSGHNLSENDQNKDESQDKGYK